MTSSQRALDSGRTSGGYTEGRLDRRADDVPDVARRTYLDVQTRLDELERALDVVKATALTPSLSLRVDIDAGQATVAAGSTSPSVTIDGTDLVIAYTSPLPAGRRVWFSDQVAGSVLEYRMQANTAQQTRVGAYDQTGAPVSLAIGTFSVAVEVWS